MSATHDQRQRRKLTTVRAEKLYKVFGRRPREAVRQLEDGRHRSEIDAPGATPAVIDASFEVNEGEIFVVMGLSGSGKSTLIRMLNGLLPATSGRVLVGDDDITALSNRGIRHLRQQTMSMVFQHFALFPHRTVLDNAAYGLRIQGTDKSQARENAREALRMVGLEGWDGRLPNQLSGGMQQRVGLARALAADTNVLLMDEAFSALDPLIRRDMQDQLITLQAQLNKTVIFITHDLNEAMRLGDRIAMMRDGRIEQVGSAEEILNNPANDYVAQFIQDVDRARVLTAGSVMVKPVVTIGAESGPRASLHTMREYKYAALFVTDRAGRLVGSIEDTQAAEGAGRGEQTIQSRINTNLPTAHTDTQLLELFTPSAESHLPLAVVDDDNTLLGVIPRATLLAAVGDTASAPEQPNGGDGNDTTDAARSSEQAKEASAADA